MGKDVTSTDECKEPSKFEIAIALIAGSDVVACISDPLDGGRVCACCKDWLAHWAKNSLMKVRTCAVEGCEESENLAGAHVRRYIWRRQEYVIPLCKKHSRSEHGYMICKFDIAAVSVASCSKCSRGQEWFASS